MARDFDGVDDVLDCGSDASVDDFTTYTLMAWMVHDADQSGSWGTKQVVGDDWYTELQAASNNLYFNVEFSGGGGEWSVAAILALATLGHLAITYDNGAVANNPTVYKDGVAQTVSRDTAPIGTANLDNLNSLRFGAGAAAFNPFDGKLGHLVYHNAILTAAQVNRARWWGCAPGGPSTVKVWHPLWTSDTNNRGTATANGTLTGTTMDNANLPRVERCWGSMMGCGR